MNTQRKQARNATIGRTYDAIRAYNAKRQAEYEAHLLTPEGEADRDARNNAMVRNMREQQTFDALRAIADKAHQLEARGLVDNVYAEVRERATNANLQFTTSQMHDAIEQSNREFHALEWVRAELKGMVGAEELTRDGYQIPVQRECAYCCGSIVECRVSVPVNGLYVVQQCTTCGRSYPELTR